MSPIHCLARPSHGIAVEVTYPKGYLRSAAKYVFIVHMQKIVPISEVRRGSAPAADAYLRAVGQRVRSERQRLSMSRRALAERSGVSERYLAELERGAGNASLLVLRKVAQALSLRVEDLASEPEYNELGIAAE